MSELQKTDPAVYKILAQEAKRQSEGIELIPSENYVSASVLEAMGSIFTNKYSEGYPGKRYYGGQQFVDELETLAIERVKKLFNVAHANVQPYSGSPANLAVYFATCAIGDVVMGQNLPDGGHLTHGWKVNFTGVNYKSVPYHVKADGYIDIEEVRRLAREHRPRLLWCGATAYVREFPFKELGEIADEVGAYFAADIAHISGLIIGGVHPSPSPYADMITTTTHKTLRGPRGGMIMVTEKGLKKDATLAEKIDRAIFPGLQGGPHDHTTAAIAVALGEASRPEFRDYAHQVVANAKVLAKTLMDEGMKLVSNGTENHMILIDLTPDGPGRGAFLQEALDEVSITLNKNTIPADPSSPFYPSGVRLGTPAATTRGMKEIEMQKIGAWIARVYDEIKGWKLPETKEERTEVFKKFRREIAANKTLEIVRYEVQALCKTFPVPGISDTLLP